jgi:hypothetical protein
LKPWEPKKARSLLLQVAASLLLRPDNTETEVQILASAALFNHPVFETEDNFRAFLKQNMGWNDQHLDSLLTQMSQNPPNGHTHE